MRGRGAGCEERGGEGNEWKNTRNREDAEVILYFTVH